MPRLKVPLNTEYINNFICLDQLHQKNGKWHLLNFFLIAILWVSVQSLLSDRLYYSVKAAPGGGGGVRRVGGRFCRCCRGGRSENWWFGGEGEDAGVFLPEKIGEEEDRNREEKSNIWTNELLLQQRSFNSVQGVLPRQHATWREGLNGCQPILSQNF